MSFAINAGTLIVGALIFLLAVFVKPMVLVLRDKMVWWWMLKYLINEQLFKDIKEYGKETELQPCREWWSTDFARDEGSEKYVYHGREKICISVNKFIFLLEYNDLKIKWYADKTLEFSKASSLYDSLVKHYSQDKENPIEAALSKEKKDFIWRDDENYETVLHRIINDAKLDYIKSIGTRNKGKSKHEEQSVHLKG